MMPRHLMFFLLFGLGLTVEATAQSLPTDRLLAVANQLAETGPIRMTGNVRCDLHGADGSVRPAFRGSDGRALLDVAVQPRVYLFVHGFDRSTFGGRPPESTVVEAWRAHVDLLRGRRGDFAACYLRFDTRTGFGDHQPDLANLLFALRWLSDHPSGNDATSEIYLVGHSAGGNYIKHAMVALAWNLKASGVPMFGTTSPTPMHVVMLATPHYGTEMSRMAGALSAFYRWFSDYTAPGGADIESTSDREWQDRLAGEYEYMVRSPGARQLSPMNQQLILLNEGFARTVPANVHVYGFASPSDLVAPPDPRPIGSPATVRYSLRGVSHSGFLDPGASSELADCLRLAYGFPDSDCPSRAIIEATPVATATYAFTRSPTPRFGIAPGGPGTARTDLSLAVERYLRTIARGEYSDDAMARLSDDVARLVSSAGLRPGFYEQLWGTDAEGNRVFELWRIPNLADGSLTSAQDRAAAEHLQEEIKDAFVPGIDLDQPFAHPNLRSRYVRTRTLERPQHARVADRGVGSLQEERLTRLSLAVHTLATYERMMGGDEEDRGPNAYVDDVDKLGIPTEDIWVVGARYRVEERGYSSIEYFYWHESFPPGVAEAARSLPADHPFFSIGDPVPWAPDRRPAQTPVSSLRPAAVETVRGDAQPAPEPAPATTGRARGLPGGSPARPRR